MLTMKGLVTLFCGLFFLACAGEESAEEGMEADTLAMEEEPAGIMLADVAGSWNVRVNNEAGDSVSGYRLDATADPSGWTINFPGREPVPVRDVTAAGDSITMVAGPFESSIRAGVMVTVEVATRLEGDRLISTTVAHYETTEPDSVVTLRSEGTRVP